jgi:hypothetical protein
MMVRTEKQVRSDQHGRIEGREVGDDEIDDALEYLALAECSEGWNAVCHVRIPEEELVVSEPFVEGTTPDVLVVVTSAEGILALKSPQMMVFSSKGIDPSIVKTLLSSRDGGK